MDSSRSSAPSQVSDKNSCRNSASDAWSVITGPNSGRGCLHDSMQDYRPHRRRPFDQHEREEVAAVRRVGACASCRKRKVKCLHALSSPSALSLHTLRSGRDSEHTENSKMPSLSNSMLSATSSGGRTTQSRRPSGDGKTLDDSVMLERFLGDEGGVRWLDGMEAKMGYDDTDKKDIKAIFAGKSSGLGQFSDHLYPTTIDFSDEIIVFPARRQVPMGENIPWDLLTGREGTQPRRVQKHRPNNSGHRRTSRGHARLSSDPRLLDVLGETTRDLSQMNLASTPRQQASEFCDDTWGQSSQHTIMPPAQSTQISSAATIPYSLLQNHAPVMTSGFGNPLPSLPPFSNTMRTIPNMADVESTDPQPSLTMDIDSHGSSSFQGSIQTPASDGFPNPFDSSHLTPMRYSHSFSHQRPGYFPAEALSLPHNSQQDMSRQPSLGWESASSRDGTWPLSPQLSRNHTRPSNDFNQTTSSPLRQPHDQTTRVVDVPPLTYPSYPSDLIVEYSEGPPIKAPIESYEYTSEDIDEQLRLWESQNRA